MNNLAVQKRSSIELISILEVRTGTRRLLRLNSTSLGLNKRNELELALWLCLYSYALPPSSHIYRGCKGGGIGRVAAPLAPGTDLRKLQGSF